MRKFLIGIMFICFSTASTQNIPGIENFIFGSESDRDLLVNEYFKPLFNSMQFSMSESWSRTAKTHKKLGFDFTFYISGINIPKSKTSFDVVGFNSLTSTSLSNPTFFGGESLATYNIEMDVPGTNYTISNSFSVPNGHGEILKEGRLILPNLQFSIGIPFKTDLILRYVPETDTKGASFKSLGVGIKHNLLQYFKPAKALPINISALISASNIKGSYNLSESSEIGGENQSIDLNINNKSAGLILSLDLKLFSLYSSISQVLNESSFKMNGQYILNYELSSNENNVELIVVDPIQIDNKLNYIKKNIGFSFTFPVLELFVDYSIQDYNSINAGISIGLR